MVFSAAYYHKLRLLTSLLYPRAPQVKIAGFRYGELKATIPFLLFSRQKHSVNNAQDVQRSLKNMVTNTLMLKFLFGLRCTKRTWVAYCKHHLHVVTTEIYAFDPRWHQGLYTGVEKIGVTCLQPGSNNLPHVSVCCKSLASQVLLKEPEGIEITGPHAANRTWKWLRHCSCEVMDHAIYSPELAFHDFLLFGPTKKHVTSKQFVTDTYLQQAVTSYPQTLDTDCSTPGHKTCCYGETNA